MKFKLTNLQILKLIFFSSIKIGGKKYKLPWLIDTIKILIDYSFIMGGIIFVSVVFDKLFELINLILPGYISPILSIIFILIINILIIKFSPLVEIEDNKIDIDKSINIRTKETK